MRTVVNLWHVVFVAVIALGLIRLLRARRG